MQRVDFAFQQVMQYLNTKSQERTLWVADENTPYDIPSSAVNIEVICNRYDLHLALQKAGWSCEFNDFELNAYSDASFDRIVYRISKEKPLVHHIINHAFRMLKTNGCLVLIGDKSEGIKTFSRKTSVLFQTPLVEHKVTGSLWVSEHTKSHQTSDTDWLDDQNYSELRAKSFDNGKTYYTKPGLFGWQKIDKGSAFLIDELPNMLGDTSLIQGSVLDLGCGFGYLSVELAKYPIELTCTDNNAAALLACTANLTSLGHQGAVVPSDAGAELSSSSFDLVVCNPPFHSGFSTSSELTQRFLNQSARLLKPKGMACFVVNQHIALEKLALSYFRDVKLCADNGHFKLLTLQAPKIQKDSI